MEPQRKSARVAFDQIKYYEMLNTLKIWTVGMSSGITLS